jgi:hypothetical protein
MLINCICNVIGHTFFFLKKLSIMIFFCEPGPMMKLLTLILALQLGGCSCGGIEDLEVLALCIHILIIVVLKLVKKSVICNETTNICLFVYNVIQKKKKKKNLLKIRFFFLLNTSYMDFVIRRSVHIINRFIK